MLAAMELIFMTTTEFISSATSSISSCSTLSVDDGGLILTTIVGLVIAVLLIALNWVFWEWWIEMKQAEAEEIQLRPKTPDSEGSVSSPTEKKEKNEQLRWYKFYYQVLKTKDIVLQKRHGDDGILYLHFTEAMIILMLILCVLSLVVIMPINMQGHGESTTFGKLTIMNLDPHSDLLWIHTLIAPLYLLIASVIMESFRSELEIEAPVEVDQAVVIEGTMIEKEDMVKYLQVIGMADDMLDIQHVYDVEILYDLLQEKEEATRMETRYKDKKFEDPDEEHVIASEGCLCCLAVEEPAIQYYKQQKLELEQRFEEERRLCRESRVDKMFVVWNSGGDSQQFINIHKPTQVSKLLKHKLTRSSIWWTVNKAPLHYDINWENYAMGWCRWWTRVILINIVVLFIVLFFTTPVIIVQAIYSFLSEDDSVDSTTTDFWSDYATILLLLVLEAILPQIVNLSCSLERHKTKTRRNTWCLWKVFIYLLISELFMPAFGYTSLASLLESFNETDDDGSLWICVFSSYTTAFFCQLLISAALIGRSIELLNVEGIVRYIYYLIESETQREYKKVYQKMRDRFNIGFNYGKLVAFSAISISFSVICPIITIFGLLFVLCKHSVDKYLMIYFHQKCGSYGPKTHKDATTYVVFSACLLQFFMLIFDLLYIGLYDNKTIFAICVWMFIVSVYIFGWWEHFMIWLFPQKPTTDALGRRIPADQLINAYIPVYLKPGANTFRQFPSTTSNSTDNPTSKLKVRTVDYGTMDNIEDTNTPKAYQSSPETASQSVPSIYPQTPSPFKEEPLPNYRNNDIP